MDKNDEIFKRGIEGFAKNFIEKYILDVCDRAAQRIVELIEEGGHIPFKTGNLQDSTGVGVYNNGVLTSYTPLPAATVPNPQKPPTWGYKELEKALASGASEYSDGIWIVLFVGTQPYAMKVAEDTEYNMDLIEDFASLFFDEMQPMLF